ncbi:MAG: sulfotransferase family 2 domain-containing protein [Anaerolineae bacterium]|nr:sulfotransferase family 2 domain-containing protein [Anaerolineae bacterium]
MTAVTSSSGEQSLVLFLHIPKTGGTTMWGIARRFFESHAIRVMTGDTEADDRTIQQLLTTSDHGYRFIGGHFLMGVQDVATRPYRSFTFLRDPADRAISDYYRIVRQPKNLLHETFVEEQVSLEEGLRRMQCNIHTRYLSGTAGLDGECTADDLARAKQNLVTRFDVVGLLEHFDESLLLLMRAFGWPMPYYRKRNVGSNRPDVLPDQMYELATELNALDVELYAYAQTLFEEQVERAGDTLRQDLQRLRLVNPLWQRWATLKGLPKQLRQTIRSVRHDAQQQA